MPTIIEFLILTIALVLFLIIWLFAISWMVRRNVPKVIDIFRKKNAIGILNAKTLQELGLQPPTFLQRLIHRRDYKPQALDLLVQTNVVFTTEDHKLYITEESVAAATWLKLKKKSPLTPR